MVLSPLAVVLLAQLGTLLLGIIGYQKLQKKRLLRELKNMHGTDHARYPADEQKASGSNFDQQQVELLLNRSLQGLDEMATEAPVIKKNCQAQQGLILALAECLSIPMTQTQEAPTTEPQAAMAARTEAGSDDDILTQEALDETLLGDLDSLETSNEAEDDELSLPGESPEMPEDTLQATLDSLDDFDFSDLEEELLKEDGGKPKK